jgi:hypothetical protein
LIVLIPFSGIIFRSFLFYNQPIKNQAMKIKLLLFFACTITAFQTARCQPYVYIPDSSLRVILSQLDSALITGDSMNLFQSCHYRYDLPGSLYEYRSQHNGH